MTVTEVARTDRIWQASGAKRWPYHGFAEMVAVERVAVPGLEQVGVAVDSAARVTILAKSSQSHAGIGIVRSPASVFGGPSTLPR